MAATKQETTLTKAQLDKALALRKKKVKWDGPGGVCEQLGVKSAIPVREALRAAGGKYAAAVPAQKAS